MPTTIHEPIEINRLILKRKGWFPNPDDDPEDRYWVDSKLGKTEVSVTDNPPPFCFDFGIAWRHVLTPLQKTHATFTYEDWHDKEESQFIVAFLHRGRIVQDSRSGKEPWSRLSQIAPIIQAKEYAIAPTMPLAICLAYLKSEGVEIELAPWFENELWRVVEGRRDVRSC